MQNVARSLRTHTVQVDTETAEHVDGDPLAFTYKAEKEVFGADVVVPHEARLIDSQLDHTFGARCQCGLPEGSPLTPPHRPFDGPDHLPRFDTEFTQHFDGHTILLAHKAEQQVFRSNIVMI